MLEGPSSSKGVSVRVMVLGAALLATLLLGPLAPATHAQYGGYGATTYGYGTSPYGYGTASGYTGYGTPSYGYSGYGSWPYSYGGYGSTGYGYSGYGTSAGYGGFGYGLGWPSG